MFKASPARSASVPDDDDDSISITSTQDSEQSEGHEYEVDRVLAEKIVKEKSGKGKKFYLLLWQGYSEKRATWEPRANICDPKILDAWRERQKNEDQGIETRFDVKSFDAQKADRCRRRKAKRKRRGITVSDSESDDDESVVEAAEVNASAKPLEKTFGVRVTEANAQPLTGANAQPLKDTSSEAELPRNPQAKENISPVSDALLRPLQFH